MKICPSCGHENNPLLRACAECGADLALAMESRPFVQASLGRRLFGGLLSLLVGFVALALLVITLTISRESSGVTMIGVVWIAVATVMTSSFFAWPGALAFLVVYVFTPRSSLLWRWPIATGCGLLAGVALSLLYGQMAGLPPSAPLSRFLSWFAAFVGGFTCLFATLTADRFHNRRT